MEDRGLEVRTKVIFKKCLPDLIVAHAQIRSYLGRHLLSLVIVSITSLLSKKDNSKSCLCWW